MSLRSEKRLQRRGMPKKPDPALHDRIMQEISRTTETLRNTSWEEIDSKGAEDEGEIQLRKERAAADREAELARKEQQKNKYRLPFAFFSGLLAVGWLAFTAVLIVKSSLEEPQVNVDYRVLIAMLGTAFGTMYTPLRVLAKYLFNGHDG